MAAPMELNVFWTSDKREMRLRIEMAIKLGYETIAVNNATDQVSSKSSKKIANLPTIKSPEDILPNEAELQEIKKSLGIRREIKLRSRFTADFNHIDQTKRIQVCCQSLDVDIISLDMKEKLPYRVHRTTAGVAVQRGIYFEIQYAPVIRDSLFRRNTISNAIHLYNTLRGKNILVSSGCENAMELRGPYDVQNLALMFGLKPEEAKNSITYNCHKCLLHAQTTGPRITKRVISIEKLPQPEVETIDADDKTDLLKNDKDSQISDKIETETSKKTKNKEKLKRSAENNRTNKNDTELDSGDLCTGQNGSNDNNVEPESKKLKLVETS